MMKKVQLLLSILLLASLLAACAPAAPAPAPPAPAPVKPATAPVAAPLPQAPAKAGWEVEWEKTLDAARKEGRLLLYESLGPVQRRAVMNTFEDKFGIRTESVTVMALELAAKLSAEHRAGIYSGDVSISGSTTYLVYKGLLDTLDPLLILPDVTDPGLIKKTWYFGELPWGDKAHTMLVGLMDLQRLIMINTTMLKVGEITSYADLMNPKWKGKISIQDPRVSGMGLFWFAVSLELGDLDVNFMRDLAAKQELFITRDRRLQVDWLAKGKHAIAIAPHSTVAAEFIAMGAPVEQLGMGTPWVSGSSSGIGVWKKQPHPNATKVFLNWLLSQEGATLHSQAVGAQSQRLDVPTSHLAAPKVLKPGLKVFRGDQEDFAVKKDSYYVQLAKEVFGP